MNEAAALEKNNDKMGKWLALFVVVVGTFMAMLDSSIVNIALSKMMSVFGATLDSIKWVITCYTLAMGATVPLAGYLTNKIGSKKLYIYSMAIFTVGSLLCGFAWSNSSMIVFRIIQAIGGGMIMPVGMSMVMEIFPIEERGVALGVWGVASMAAPAIGPTLGGYIIEYLDWRLIFNINVPVGIFGVIIAIFLLKETPRKEVKGFDIVGFISAAVGISCILYVLGEGSSIDWGDIKNPLLLTLGLFSMLILVVNELMVEDPLLDLRVFKIYNFTLSQIITGFTTMALMGGTYVLPLFLQNVRGYTAMQTGTTMFWAAIASGVMMPISGTLTNKFGAKSITIVGLVILMISSYKLTFLDINTTVEYIIVISTIRGVGMGLAMMPVNTAGLNDVPIELMSKATTVSTVMRQIISSLSVTIMTTLITGRLNDSYVRLSEQITNFNQTAVNYIKQLTSMYMQYGTTSSEAQVSAVMSLANSLYIQAYIDGMDYAIAVSTVTVLAAIILVLCMRIKKPKKGEVEHESGGKIAAIME